MPSRAPHETQMNSQTILFILRVRILSWISATGKMIGSSNTNETITRKPTSLFLAIRLRRTFMIVCAYRPNLSDGSHEACQS